MNTCEMIIAHHSDCECASCKAWEDAQCGKPAVGFVRDGSFKHFVCDEHAAMVLDDPPAYGNLTWLEGFPLLSNTVK